MLKAANRVDFAMFTFAKSSGIDDTMIRVARSGTHIRGYSTGVRARRPGRPPVG